MSEQITASFQFDADAKFFAGHFVGNPIVPGVVWLQLLEAEILKKLPQAQIAKVQQAKFSSFVKPGEVVDLIADFKEVATGFAVDFKFYNQAVELVAAGKLSVKNHE